MGTHCVLHQLIEPTEEHKFWASECAKLFGGMDVFAIDALHGKDGKDYIIELNDTAIGILASIWEEESNEIVRLAIERMDAIYCSEAHQKSGGKKGTKKHKKKKKANNEEGKEGRKEKKKGK